MAATWKEIKTVTPAIAVWGGERVFLRSGAGVAIKTNHTNLILSGHVLLNVIESNLVFRRN